MRGLTQFRLTKPSRVGFNVIFPPTFEDKKIVFPYSAEKIAYRGVLMRIHPSVFKNSLLAATVAIAIGSVAQAAAENAPSGVGPTQSNMTLSGDAAEYAMWGLIQDAQNEIKHISSGVLYLSARLDAMSGAVGHDEAVKALGRLAGRNNAVGKRLNEMVAAISGDRNQLMQFAENLRNLPQVTTTLKAELTSVQEMVRDMELSSTIPSDASADPMQNSSLNDGANATKEILTDAQKSAVEAAAAQAIATAKPDIPPVSEMPTEEDANDPVEKFTLKISPDNVKQKLVPGVFENHPVSGQDTSAAQMKIAVIDASNGSKEWLRHHRAYLEQEGIPVMVIDTTEADFQALHQEFLGDVQQAPTADQDELEVIPNGRLILGLEPEVGRGLMHNILWQMGVRHYPVVIEDGMAWQNSPSTR